MIFEKINQNFPGFKQLLSMNFFLTIFAWTRSRPIFTQIEEVERRRDPIDDFEDLKRRLDISRGPCCLPNVSRSIEEVLAIDKECQDAISKLLAVRDLDEKIQILDRLLYRFSRLGTLKTEIETEIDSVKVLVERAKEKLAQLLREPEPVAAQAPAPVPAQALKPGQKAGKPAARKVEEPPAAPASPPGILAEKKKK